jgi:hypothetical protein
MRVATSCCLYHCLLRINFHCFVTLLYNSALLRNLLSSAEQLLIAERSGYIARVTCRRSAVGIATCDSTDDRDVWVRVPVD